MDEYNQVLHDKDTLSNGRYVIEQFINHGKYAQVYVATDTRLASAQDGDTRVAVKILNPEYWQGPEGREAQERLAREGRLQKEETLGRHRNIVRVLETGVQSCTSADGRQTFQVPFLIMEYVEHITLEEYLRQNNGKLAPNDPTLIAIIAQLGDVLGWIHSHEQGVVHRDLAAHNILLRCTKQDGDCQLLSTHKDFVKLSDFGLAFTGDEETITQDRFNRIAANIRCASPNILSGETPMPQDDLYSFGVLVFRLLTGEYPFPLLDDFAAYVKSVRTELVMFPDPEAIPEAAQNCLIKAMGKTRQERYSTAQEMATALIVALTEGQLKGKKLAMTHGLSRPAETRVTPSRTTRPQPPAVGPVAAAKPIASPKMQPRKRNGGIARTLGLISLIVVALAVLIVGALNKWTSAREKPVVLPTAQLEPVTVSGYDSTAKTPQPSSAPTTPASVLAQPASKSTSATTGLADVGDLAFAYVSHADGVSSVVGRSEADAGPDLTLLNGQGDVQNLTWSPDNTLLAYVADVEGAPAVYVSDGINVRRLSPPGTVERWPTWRPDGNALVVSTEAEGRAYLSLVDLASGHHSALTGSHFNAWAPAWSPVNDYLAFVSDMGTGEDVYVLSLNDLDRAPVNISRSGDVYRDAPAWAGDGKWMVYATANGLRWVSIENLEPGAPHPFTQNGQDRAPCFLNDRGILFQRTSGAGTLSIYQAQLGTEAQQRLVDNAAWPACRP